jgi:hypothetical protein
MKPAKKGTQQSPKSTRAAGKKPKGFTDEERDAIREHLQERRLLLPKCTEVQDEVRDARL